MLYLERKNKYREMCQKLKGLRKRSRKRKKIAISNRND